MSADIREMYMEIPPGFGFLANLGMGNGTC